MPDAVVHADPYALYQTAIARLQEIGVCDAVICDHRSNITSYADAASYELLDHEGVRTDIKFLFEEMRNSPLLLSEAALLYLQPIAAQHFAD